jgi:hypothetical protein
MIPSRGSNIGMEKMNESNALLRVKKKKDCKVVTKAHLFLSAFCSARTRAHRPYCCVLTHPSTPRGVVS